MSTFRLISKGRLAIMLSLALILSAFVATPAFADGETPPPPDTGTTEVSTDSDTTEATPAPTEEAAPADTTTTEPSTDVVSADTTTTDGTTDTSSLDVVPTDSTTTEATTGAAATDATTADLLATLPEDTSLVVVNADGEQVSLASDEASEIIAGGDPIWCPVGVTPVSGAGGCSPTYATWYGIGLYFWLLVNDPAQAGVIWFEDSYVASGVGDGLVELDGSLFANVQNYSLTIKGGWTGAGTTIDQTSPSEFDEGFSIINWVGNITISDILIDGADIVSASDQAALNVDTNGSIVLNRVQSNNNTNSGAQDTFGANLDNDGGTGNVTVTNSSFGNNDGRGITIYSKGSITLKNVMVYDNGNASLRYGAFLVNNTAATPKPVSVTNSTFSNNGDTGLYIASDGTVTLSYVNASLNTINGAFIDTLGAVTLSGVNTFNNNGFQGLEVDNDGTITVAKTTANDNGGFGISLDNSGALTPKNVLLTGFTIAGNNGDDGIAIFTQGAVTAANLTAHDNAGYGVYINNGDYDLGTHSVLITGTNYFHDNTSDGLNVKATGAVTMYNVTSIFNGRGVYVNNDINGAGGVTLYGYGIFHDNSNTGLYILSDGAVTLNYITSVKNTGYGLYVNNAGSATPLPVYVKGTNLFEDNTFSGARVLSNGAVTLNNITALDNDDNGVYVDNHWWGTPYAVSITGSNRIQGNDDIGVEIYSRGVVTLNNMSVIGNGFASDAVGVYIDNQYTSTSQQAVYLKGTNVINNNSSHGLRILSYGAVSLSNITAINNGCATPGADPDCTVVDDGNGQGVYVTNTGGTYAKGVTVSGVNVFNYNDGNGLYVVSDGAISVSKPTAYYNGYNGLHLDNTGPFQANVTISGFGQFSYNGNEGGGGPNEQAGLDITTHGTVTLAYITATSNYGSGAYIDTRGFNAPHAVTLSGTNIFNYNGNTGTESGLVIKADGNITISNLTADYNYYRGADLDNYTNWVTNPDRTTATPAVPFTSFGSIFLNGFANFEGNITADGVYGLTHGSITTTRVTASDNGDGAGERGINLTADGNITMTCTVAYGNDFRNLDVYAGGKLTLKGLLSFGGISLGDLLADGAPGDPVITSCP
jgi:hypothetical protein